MTDNARDLPPPGFNFENCRRNALMLRHNIHPPKMTTTGTTIAALIFKDGVVIGADTRATNSDMVRSKTQKKLYKLADNIWCAGAGGTSDIDFCTQLIQANLRIHSFATNSQQIPVIAAQTLLEELLFRFEGEIKANLIIGGVDKKSHIIEIHENGESERQPYAALGSGMFKAISILQESFCLDLEEREAKDILRRAITAGINEDLLSGSHIRMCTITRNGPNEEELITLNDKPNLIESHEVPPKTTPTLITEQLKK